MSTLTLRIRRVHRGPLPPTRTRVRPPHPDFGFHRGNWQSLQHFYKAKTTCGRSLSKSCTDALKISVIYRFLETWLGRDTHAGGPETRHPGVRGALWTDPGPPGIAAGEEADRVPTGGPTGCPHAGTPVPLDRTPLDRGACQAYLRAIGRPVPPPSNCVYCPFKSESRYCGPPPLPAAFASGSRSRPPSWPSMPPWATGTWVSSAADPARVLATAERTYAHLADADLDAYRFSHGHGVCSIY